VEIVVSSPTEARLQLCPRSFECVSQAARYAAAGRTASHSTVSHEAGSWSIRWPPAPPEAICTTPSYFFKLGSFGFGGPAALVGHMRRDLVEDRRLIDESTYNLSIALAQIMPGPLAAQTAMAIGYFQSGVVLQRDSSARHACRDRLISDEQCRCRDHDPRNHHQSDRPRDIRRC
jgi:chromate transporter